MEKILSCGEISDFCKEFEQFMAFYQNLCRFCYKFAWRKISVEKKWQIWGLDETHIGVHIQQSNTHTKSVTQCTRRYSRTITQGVEITATQGTEVNICTKSQKATRSRIKGGSATACKGELGEITWGDEVAILGWRLANKQLSKPVLEFDKQRRSKTI